MEKAAELVRGAYVRVHGKLSEFEGRWRIQAFHVRLVTDFNEARIVIGLHSLGAVPGMHGKETMCAQVTYHNLQAIFQAVHVAKGLPGSGRPLAEVRSQLGCRSAVAKRRGPNLTGGCACADTGRRRHGWPGGHAGRRLRRPSRRPSRRR